MGLHVQMKREIVFIYFCLLFVEIDKTLTVKNTFTKVNINMQMLLLEYLDIWKEKMYCNKMCCIWTMWVGKKLYIRVLFIIHKTIFVWDKLINSNFFSFFLFVIFFCYFRLIHRLIVIYLNNLQITPKTQDAICTT